MDRVGHMGHMDWMGRMDLGRIGDIPAGCACPESGKAP